MNKGILSIIAAAGLSIAQNTQAEYSSHLTYSPIQAQIDLRAYDSTPTEGRKNETGKWLIGLGVLGLGLTLLVKRR
ncbi:MAG: hypothetical protein AABX66_04305 [Nanoarchaeota archaeon]|mgnify:CR=1 FL=1